MIKVCLSFVNVNITVYKSIISNKIIKLTQEILLLYNNWNIYMIKIFVFSQFLECITNFERTTSYTNINVVHMNNDSTYE